MSEEKAGQGREPQLLVQAAQWNLGAHPRAGGLGRCFTLFST